MLDFISTAARLYIFTASMMLCTLFAFPAMPLPFFGNSCQLMFSRDCTDSEAMGVGVGAKEWLFPAFAFLGLTIVNRNDEQKLKNLAAKAKLVTALIIAGILFSLSTNVKPGDVNNVFHFVALVWQLLLMILLFYVEENEYTAGGMVSPIKDLFFEPKLVLIFMLAWEFYFIFNFNYLVPLASYYPDLTKSTTMIVTHGFKWWNLALFVGVLLNFFGLYFGTPKDHAALCVAIALHVIGAICFFSIRASVLYCTSDKIVESFYLIIAVLGVIKYRRGGQEYSSIPS